MRTSGLATRNPAEVKSAAAIRVYDRQETKTIQVGRAACKSNTRCKHIELTLEDSGDTTLTQLDHVHAALIPYKTQGGTNAV